MPKLYDALAEWWPLLSAPFEYEVESKGWRRCLVDAGDEPAQTLLELGSGGGNNASYLKRDFELTLVDLSPGMLAHSRRLNPECAHHEGDMRSVRLGATFDRVFIHDAICYMATLEDLHRTLETAFLHLRPGGGMIVAPDFVRETFRPGTEHGGYDDGPRGLRYLEWTWDPDPSDHTYIADYAFLLREADGRLRVEHDRHVEGLFSRNEWRQVLDEAGFEARTVVMNLEDDVTLEVFSARRPDALPSW